MMMMMMMMVVVRHHSDSTRWVDAHTNQADWGEEKGKLRMSYFHGIMNYRKRLVESAVKVINSGGVQH
jgi:hypothetical protein